MRTLCTVPCVHLVWVRSWHHTIHTLDQKCTWSNRLDHHTWVIQMVWPRSSEIVNLHFFTFVGLFWLRYWQSQAIGQNGNWEIEIKRYGHRRIDYRSREDVSVVTLTIHFHRWASSLRCFFVFQHFPSARWTQGQIVQNGIELGVWIVQWRTPDRAARMV